MLNIVEKTSLILIGALIVLSFLFGGGCLYIALGIAITNFLNVLSE